MAHAETKPSPIALDASLLNPAWSLPNLLDQNPLASMAEANALRIDLRGMRREARSKLHSTKA